MPTLLFAISPKRRPTVVAIRIADRDGRPLGPAGEDDEIRDHEAGNPEERGLRQRDHAAVAGQKYEACGDDPEPQDLRAEDAVLVVREDEGREKEDEEHHGCHGQAEELRALEPHAGRPNRPSGRTARTAISRTKVKRIE